MVQPGTFIAAVGADNENKQEIDPRLLAESTLVTDLTAQAATIGDLHHAIIAGTMSRDDVHAELGEVVAGRKPGRRDAHEITIFDSTGTGLQDVAAAIAVYRRATKEKAGQALRYEIHLGNGAARTPLGQAAAPGCRRAPSAGIPRIARHDRRRVANAIPKKSPV